MRGPLVAIALAIVALWLLAVWSMLGGNPTAVNAVIGIPFGSIFGGCLIWMGARS